MGEIAHVHRGARRWGASTGTYGRRALFALLVAGTLLAGPARADPSADSRQAQQRRVFWFQGGWRDGFCLGDLQAKYYLTVADRLWDIGW
jgi:hypothetical protein